MVYLFVFRVWLCEEFLIIGIGGSAQGGRPPTVNIRYMNLVSVDFVCLWVESVGGGVYGCFFVFGSCHNTS